VGTRIAKESIRPAKELASNTRDDEQSEEGQDNGPMSQQMFIAAFARVKKILRYLDPAHVREWDTEQVVRWTKFEGVDERLVRGFELQKTDGSGLLRLQTLSVPVAMLVLDIDGSFHAQAPQKSSTPLPIMGETHTAGSPSSSRPRLQRAVSAETTTLRRLSRERYQETPTVTAGPIFGQEDEPSLLGVQQEIPPPHWCDDGERCQTFIDRRDLLNNLREQYNVPIKDDLSGPVTFVNHAGKTIIVDASSPVPIHPLWSLQTVPLSPCSAKSPVRQSLQEADMMWLGRRDKQEGVAAYLDAQMQQAGPSQHAPRLLRSVTAPSPSVFSTPEDARPGSETPVSASSKLKSTVPTSTSSTAHAEMDPFVSHPAPATWSTYRRPTLAISTQGHAASLSSGSPLSPIKRPGEPLSFTRSLSNSPLASRTPVTPATQSLASLSGSPTGLALHSSSGRRPPANSRSRSESPLASREPVTPVSTALAPLSESPVGLAQNIMSRGRPSGVTQSRSAFPLASRTPVPLAAQVLAPVLASTHGLSQTTMSGGRPSGINRSQSASPLASRAAPVERTGSASARLELPTLRELSLRDTLPPPDVSVTSRSPPRFSPLRSARSSLDLRPRAWRSATAPTTPFRASLDDTRPIIPINDWSPSRRPRRSQSFNARTALATVEERTHSINPLEALPRLEYAQSHPAGSTATGPEIAYEGWMRQRKTKLLRHEWILRYYRLSGTLLTVHASDLPVHAAPLKAYDIYEHSVTMNGAATRMKLNVWMKRLKLSATPEDMPFVFELIPNTFMLGPQDQRQGARPLKVRYFAVDSNEARADWARNLTHATNDRNLEQGHETGINGEVWT